MWTRLPCDNFHLLMACSILESQKGELIGSNHDFNTILKVCAGLLVEARFISSKMMCNDIV